MPTELIDLKTDLRAKSPIKLSISSIFDPSNRRRGEEYLELYPTGKTDVEILTIPIDWYQKGQTRTWSLDVWYARRQQADRVEEIRLSALTYGADNALGQEVVQNGYLQAKLSTAGTFVALDQSTSLGLGDFWPNSKKTLNFQFTMPQGALTPVGINAFKLRLELFRSVVYGSTAYGRPGPGEAGGNFFAKYEGRKKDILVRLHIRQ